jgi:hypothetical protein
VALLGLLAVIAISGYGAHVAGAGFEQPRYLLPLLALYGGLIAMAARGAGRSYGPSAGAALVMLALAHTLFSQLLTVSRYYG